MLKIETYYTKKYIRHLKRRRILRYRIIHVFLCDFSRIHFSKIAQSNNYTRHIIIYYDPNKNTFQQRKVFFWTKYFNSFNWKIKFHKLMLGTTMDIIAFTAKMNRLNTVSQNSSVSTSANLAPFPFTFFLKRCF